MSNPHFVSGEWLEDHLNAPDVVIVDASWYLPNLNRNGRAEYEAGHIPGAVFFDIDAIADTSRGLPHMLPSPQMFASEMGKLGIGDGALEHFANHLRALLRREGEDVEGLVHFVSADHVGYQAALLG